MGLRVQGGGVRDTDNRLRALALYTPIQWAIQGDMMAEEAYLAALKAAPGQSSSSLYILLSLELSNTQVYEP